MAVPSTSGESKVAADFASRLLAVRNSSRMACWQAGEQQGRDDHGEWYCVWRCTQGPRHGVPGWSWQEAWNKVYV